MPHKTKEARNEYKREWLIKNRTKMLEYYRAWRSIPRNKQQRAESQRIRTRKLKAVVIAHYSNNKNDCACCGENNHKFLTIDHIKGGGNKHRIEIAKQKLGKG